MSGPEPPTGTKEIIEGITEAIKQRIGSPLIFGFIFSWLAFNYKFVVVILANENYKAKFEYISKNLVFNYRDPILFSLLITVGLKIINIPIAVCADWLENVERSVRMFFQHRKPMDLKEQAETFRAQHQRIRELEQSNEIAYRAEKSNRSASEARENALRARIRVVCLKYISVVSECASDEIVDFLRGVPVPPEVADALLRKLRMLPEYDWFLRFDDFVQNLPVEDHITTKFEYNQMEAQMGIESEQFAFFVDVLFSLGLVYFPTMSDAQSCTVPVRADPYVMTMRLIRSAGALN